MRPKAHVADGVPGGYACTGAPSFFKEVMHY